MGHMSMETGQCRRIVPMNGRMQTERRVFDCPLSLDHLAVEIAENQAGSVNSNQK